MSNMHYCMNENTANDLDDVWGEWDDFDPKEASFEEVEGRIKIIELAVAIADNYGMDQARELERILDVRRTEEQEDDE